jgi:hypothetical protein
MADTPDANRAPRIPRFHQELVKFFRSKKNKDNAMLVAATAMKTDATTFAVVYLAL